MNNEETGIVKHNQSAMVCQGELSTADVIAQVELIQDVMNKVMKKDEHYGVIEGCGTKPTLYKPGAEKLGLMFRLAPGYKIQKTDLGNHHREYEITCTLTHIITGQAWGQGVGSCSTMESKYRYREAKRKCPACGMETIIKGKQEYGGGWICYAKIGGCGQKFKDGDQSIESQKTGRVENPDIADTYNTVLKMAKKRAQVDAMLTATAASDIFTQDIEDLNGNGHSNGTDKQKKEEPKKQKPKNEKPKNSVSNLRGDRQRLYDYVLATMNNDKKAIPSAVKSMTSNRFSSFNEMTDAQFVILWKKYESKVIEFEEAGKTATAAAA